MEIKYFCICLLLSSIRSSFAGNRNWLQEYDTPIIRSIDGLLFPEDLVGMGYYELGPELRSENAVEPPLKIGAFNVQTLTEKKFNRDDIMATVEKVILRYDLILITEIILKDYSHLAKLMTILNRLVPDGGKYKISMSAEHPTTRESCAFIYRSDKLTVHKAETYRDRPNIFFRKPLIVHFKSPTLRDMKEFVVLGLHVKPNKAVQELDELANVYDEIRRAYHISDVMMMGDFNADCSYVKEHDWANISLWTRPEFTWPITHSMDTTTNHRSCALDRFVYAGNNMNNGVIMSTARAFNFAEAYGLTSKETKQVSDHLPIEIQIRGKASKVAEDHLETEICLTLKDSRNTNISLEPNGLRNVTNNRGFIVATTESGDTIIQSHHDEAIELLNAVQKLDTIIPGLISKEQIQTLRYKVNYGSLQDDSSYADISRNTLRFSLMHHHNRTTVLVCRGTTLN